MHKQCKIRNLFAASHRQADVKPLSGKQGLSPHSVSLGRPTSSPQMSPHPPPFLQLVLGQAGSDCPLDALRGGRKVCRSTRAARPGEAPAVQPFPPRIRDGSATTTGPGTWPWTSDRCLGQCSHHTPTALQCPLGRSTSGGSCRWQVRSCGGHHGGSGLSGAVPSRAP